MPNFNFKKEISSPVKAVFLGDFDIDSRRLAVILNSRQTKTPCGNDPWISGTAKAVRYAVDNGQTLVTSTGMNTWELICWATGYFSGDQVIVSSIKSADEIDQTIENIINDFGLKANHTGWIFYEATAKARSAKVDWPTRDKLAISLAENILPISVRSGGNLDRLIKRYSTDNKKIITDFRTQYMIKRRDMEFKPDQIKTSIPRRKWDYITHWTRTCHGRWPGESSASFYNRLLKSNDRYPNCGLATLKNIIEERTIRASANNLRHNLKGVAFSSLHPQDVLPLMRWRKRFVRWNFEPYSIAISRQAAVKAGIQPVIYGKPELYARLAESDKPYFQSEGVDGGDWREEKEWRYLGDFDLSAIRCEDIMVIVHKSYEINTFQGLTDSKILTI
ncbi:MAG: hypothetical protein GY839_15490 [candidate division Zixibacteria bacterium]|nr:hypothetical protein [candidate division Zixibacteria bacterium]